MTMHENTIRSGRTAVVVLGMHRSGTSALAGVMSILGCDEPATLMVPNENNERGYFESSKLYQLHTRLFDSAATYWDDWLPMPAGWFDSPRAPEFQQSAIETMTAEFSRSSLFVLKDPRICRLVPFWEGVFEELGVTPGYVLTHRNPLEVAASLHKRDGYPTGLGLLIWLRHVLEAEAGTRGRPRCFTSFGQLLANWAEVAEKIQTELGFKLPRFSQSGAAEVDAFLEGSLKHHQEAPERVLKNPMLSVWVRDTYGILERWAAEGEDATDHERLDRIREAFDAASPAFGSVVKAGRDAIRHLSERTDAFSKELNTLKNEKSDLLGRNDELLADNKKLKADIESREDLIKSFEKELEQSKSRLSDSDQRLQTQFRELSDLSRILADTEAEIAALRNSSSWRLTQPLRTVIDWVRTRRG